jgi:hypothetical protein
MHTGNHTCLRLDLVLQCIHCSPECSCLLFEDFHPIGGWADPAGGMSDGPGNVV